MFGAWRACVIIRRHSGMGAQGTRALCFQGREGHGQLWIDSSLGTVAEETDMAGQLNRVPGDAKAIGRGSNVANCRRGMGTSVVVQRATSSPSAVGLATTALRPMRRLDVADPVNMRFATIHGLAPLQVRVAALGRLRAWGNPWPKYLVTGHASQVRIHRVYI